MHYTRTVFGDSLFSRKCSRMLVYSQLYGVNNTRILGVSCDKNILRSCRFPGGVSRLWAHTAVPRWLIQIMSSPTGFMCTTNKTRNDLTKHYHVCRSFEQFCRSFDLVTFGVWCCQIEPHSGITASRSNWWLGDAVRAMGAWRPEKLPMSPGEGGWFFTFFYCSSTFYFLLIEFNCTFFISNKILHYYVYYYCILIG